MKIIRILNSITVILKNGEIISSDICTDEIFNFIYNNQDDEELIKEILIPEFTAKKKLIEVKKTLLRKRNQLEEIKECGIPYIILYRKELEYIRKEYIKDLF